jgi:hypothetical protein
VTGERAELVLRVPTRQGVTIPPAWREGERIEEGGMAIHRLRRIGTTTDGGDDGREEGMDEREQTNVLDEEE